MQFSFAQLHEAIAAAVPEREALIFRDKRLSYAQLTDRSRQLANSFYQKILAFKHRQKI